MLLLVAYSWLTFSVLLIGYTYWLYPLWMKHWAKKHAANNNLLATYTPNVAVVLAAYNEVAVIEEKIKSTFNSTYPADKIALYIGSDCSNDGTDELVSALAKQDERIHFTRFDQRTGKPEIVNTLIDALEAEILILTDADTFFYPDTILELVKPFANKRVGGVQAKFETSASSGHDVGNAELLYNEREIAIKMGQSHSGCVIGAYGACYAIRKKLYQKVPKGFLVDDFFIFMKVLEQQYQTVFAPEARCRLEVSGHSKVEFKRKVRIGAGNFKNLQSLSYFWNPFASRAHFYYWSYKVLRWITPFVLALMLLPLGYLALHHQWLLYLMASFVGLLALDRLLIKWNLPSGPLRFATHFLMMNLALLFGFFRYLKNNSTGAWN